MSEPRTKHVRIEKQERESEEDSKEEVEEEYYRGDGTFVSDEEPETPSKLEQGHSWD